MNSAVKDFKEFILKGDVVALAVAVVIATAFGAVIAAFVGGRGRDRDGLRRGDRGLRREHHHAAHRRHRRSA
jgi:hypothetical protein